MALTGVDSNQSLVTSHADNSDTEVSANSEAAFKQVSGLDLSGGNNDVLLALLALVVTLLQKIQQQQSTNQTTRPQNAWSDYQNGNFWNSGNSSLYPNFWSDYKSPFLWGDSSEENSNSFF
ncbi:MAG TPA: hypothetical protein PLE99_17280 [Candidatus Thiothrix moscowensis]|uniref:hypothetical protein n=1 Tax=unclassified Thiothrix TaxID=2636184 RepID=UPI0025ECFB28|nr:MULTISPECIES: hypothetical protein [unclassified Thiothrix]HRJ54518.1 hypothetical protein [Candidatus Thiothrix moscowensis]HRJ94877.1 hypothetical protein [Candidatus Thiothrix moscowensis]